MLIYENSRKKHKTLTFMHNLSFFFKLSINSSFLLRQSCSMFLIRIKIQFKNVLIVSGNQILVKVHSLQHLIGQPVQRAQHQ